MSFLAPLFLLGATAVILPVVFHLVRRTTRQRTVFSSLLFLSPSPPRVTQRSRLEDILLLILRCLVIGLLAFGFARPFLRDSAVVDPSSRPPARLVLLVDTSASMRRDGLWDAARARVAERAQEAAPGDEVSLWTFDLSTRVLVTFAEWNGAPAGERVAMLRSRLASVQPGWGGTHLDEALTTSSEALVENLDRNVHGPRRVVLISDLQEGSQLDRLQAFEWPKGIDVVVDLVKPRKPGNAGLQLVADSSTSIPTTTQAVVRVRVSNSSDATVDRFEVGWSRGAGPDFVGRAEEVQVSPGQNRTVALSVPGDLAVDQILLRGDAEDFDNRVYLLPPRSSPLRLLYLGAETAEDQRQPLFFLRRALPPAGRLAVDLAARGPGDALDPTALKNAALFFVTDAVSRELGEALRAEVSGGKLLVFAPKTVAAFGSLGPILGLGELTANEAQPTRYALLGTVNFQHPLLVPFADPRFSDFTKIHFWKYRRFDDGTIPNARSIARFDSGDPAWSEVPLGRGRVVILASGWHPDDSQLALSTKFVPLLLSLVEWSGGGLQPVRAYVIGDTIPLAGPAAAGSTVRRPDGSVSQLATGSTNFNEALVPGIYEIPSADKTERFAVDLDGAESRTAPLPLETLEGFGTPLRTAALRAEPTAESRRQLTAIDAEARQKLWRWLILAALALLLIETIVAGWQSRRLAVAKEIVT